MSSLTAPASIDAGADAPLLLFDGVCNLCDAAVLFVIDRDPAARVRFASLQGETATSVLAGFGIRPPATGADPDSMLLVEGGRIFDRSTAALRLTRHLGGGWPLLRVFLFVPRPVRDAVYGFVARHRYRWFGRRDACRVPDVSLRARFLD